MKMKSSNLLCIGILVLGSTAMLGHCLKLPWMKGIGLASCVAPYTKVFCTAECNASGDEFESFAAKFFLRYEHNGVWEELTMTPEIYANLEGSYNRRNVYGAVIAYGPALPKEMSERTLDYALLDPGHVAKELGLPVPLSSYEVKIESSTQGSDASWILTGKGDR